MFQILIVDDEAKSSAMLQLILKKYFQSVSSIQIASSVEEAVKTLEQQPVDLVFLDISLKGESGFDLLDKIPKHSWQFITLSATKEFAFKTFEYGGAGYLLKPVNEKELAAALSHLLKMNPIASF
jgi:YesN/AraC family two-component response regulator